MHDIQPYNNARNPSLASVVQILALIYDFCLANNIHENLRVQQSRTVIEVHKAMPLS